MRSKRSTWRVLFALMLCVGMATVVGCKDDDEDNNPVCSKPSTLVGTWDLTNAHISGGGYDEDLDEGEIAELGIPTVVQMNADGSGLSDGTNEFSWCVTGNQLTITVPGAGTTSYTHSVSGSSLTMSGTEQGEGETYTLTLTWTKQ